MLGAGLYAFDYDYVLSFSNFDLLQGKYIKYYVPKTFIFLNENCGGNIQTPPITSPQMTSNYAVLNLQDFQTN